MEIGIRIDADNIKTGEIARQRWKAALRRRELSLSQKPT